MKNTICLFLMGLFFINGCSQEAIKSISTKELKALLAQENIQLMDVRTQKEVAAGAINTAIFANYLDANFYEKAAEQLDKSRPIYLYCRSGSRSGKSAKILQRNGFEVYNVLGGYHQWKKEN